MEIRAYGDMGRADEIMASKCQLEDLDIVPKNNCFEPGARKETSRQGRPEALHEVSKSGAAAAHGSRELKGVQGTSWRGLQRHCI